MPKYQYRCTECGNEFEVQQKFTDDALTSCPKCEGLLHKVYSAVGVVFKGSGFYKTDSRSSASKDGAAKESGGAKEKVAASAKPDSGSTPGSGSASTASTSAGSSN